MFDKALFMGTQRWLDELARPFLETLKAEHAELLRSHRTHTGGDAYIVGSSIFVAGGGTTRPMGFSGKVTPLSEQLVPAHQAWFELISRHNREWRRTRQILQLLVGRAKNWQDLRDMFPDAVLRPFPASGLMELTRTRPDLYAGDPADSTYPQERRLRTDFWSPELLDKYEQVAPTVNLYVSYRLL